MLLFGNQYITLQNLCVLPSINDLNNDINTHTQKGIFLISTT